LSRDEIATRRRISDMSIGNRRIVLASVMALAAAIPSLAIGETTVHEINTPFATMVMDPCTGEPVAIEGTLDTIVEITPDASGGFHNKIHNASKGTGVGLVSSTRYTYSEELDSELTSAGAATETQTLNHFLTSAGSSDNFFFKMTVHTTVNGTGVPTASVDHFDSGCRG
jgi:hypothetical protein